MDGACDHEGSGPGRLPEHLSSHHIRNGTWRDPTDVVKQRSQDINTLQGHSETAHISKNLVHIYNIYHYMSGLIQTTFELMEQPVVMSICVNNHWQGPDSLGPMACPMT